MSFHSHGGGPATGDVPGICPHFGGPVPSPVRCRSHTVLPPQGRTNTSLPGAVHPSLRTSVPELSLPLGMICGTRRDRPERDLDFGCRRHWTDREGGSGRDVVLFSRPSNHTPLPSNHTHRPSRANPGSDILLVHVPASYHDALLRGPRGVYQRRNVVPEEPRSSLTAATRPHDSGTRQCPLWPMYARSSFRISPSAICSGGSGT